MHRDQRCKAGRLRQPPDGYRRDRHVSDGAGEPGSGGTAHLRRCQALYTFTVGDDLNPLAPRKLNLVGGSRPPFVNTSVRFLNGFDYLYDAEGGFVGLRWTGRLPQSFGRVVSPSN